MIVKSDKSFNKDIEKINDKKLLIKIKNVLIEVNIAEELKDIKNIKKLR